MGIEITGKEREKILRRAKNRLRNGNLFLHRISSSFLILNWKISKTQGTLSTGFLIERKKIITENLFLCLKGRNTLTLP